VVELDGHRHISQLPSRALPCYPLAAPRNDKVHQCSNGSALDSSTASSNGPARGNKGTQGNTVLIQCMFHIIRPYAQLVVLDIGQLELQYRRCSCARSREAMEYHCNTPTTTNMTRYCAESKWIRCSQARERVQQTNNKEHIHRWLPRNLNRMSESQTHDGPRCGCNSNNRSRCAQVVAAEEGIERAHASSKAHKLPPRYRAIINNRSTTSTRGSTLTEVASERCGERYFIVIER